MKMIAAAGNTVVPALLALERLGFTVSIERSGDVEEVSATRGGESYLAEDPVAVLGLVKLIEVRGWDWRPTDAELAEIFHRYRLG
jgi:hypothetical protein